MKIRITGKGLPKAQMYNSQVGQPQSFNMDWRKFMPQAPQITIPYLPGYTPPPPPDVTIPRNLFPDPLSAMSEDEMTPPEVLADRQKSTSPTTRLSDIGIGPNYMMSDVDREIQQKYDSDPMYALKYDDSVGFGMLQNWADGKGTSRKDMKNYVKFFNKKYGTDLKLPAIGPKLARTANAVSKGIGALALAGNVVDYFDSNRKSREWERFFRQRMMENAPSTEFEGIENINTGRMFENMLPKPNQGRFNFGGVTYNPFDNMKIRITQTPDMMEYGGQSGHGLDLGRRKVYADMPESRSESVSSTMQPVPRFAANIEAERGETVYGDIDGDGAFEHMKIGGKRHSQGGTPLNVPEGSFIFSDTAKMRIKDPAVLAMFGKTVTKSGKKGYTPAELAKQYDINKYKAIMEDPEADPIAKSTAQLMVNNYNKKLGTLSVIQESMKDFPQGIPAVAKEAVDSNPIMEARFGGYNLPMYQTAGQIPPGLPAAFRISPDVKRVIDQLNAEQANQQQQSVVSTSDTRSPGQFADMSDPEFQKYIDLLKKYDTKAASDRTIINSMSDADAREFARLATKFGFKRTDDKGKQVFRVTQGSTPGFTIGTGKEKRGFFGGYTPQMYERRVAEDVLGEDAVKNMSELDIRKAYLKELGIDTAGISEDKLKDAKKLYTDPKFFDEVFYPKFTQRFAKDDYRKMLGDDRLIGAEHFDAYQSKAKPKDGTVYGFICKGVSRDGYPQIEESAFRNAEARAAAGAYTSSQEAAMNCPGGSGGGGGDIPGGGGRKGRVDFMTPDKLTLMAAAAIPPQGYFPFVSDAEFRPGQLALEDWLSQAQNIQQTYNTAANTLGNYQGPAALASNLSFLAGQAGDQVSQAISQVGNRNVDRFNQFAANETQRKQAVDMYNTAARDKRWDGYTVTKQNLDNARRRYLNTVTRAANNMWANRMYLDMVNSVNPFYNIDPRSGLSFFKSGFGPQDLGRMGSSASATGGGGLSGYDNITNIKRELMSKGLSEANAEREALSIVKGGVSNYTDTDMDGFPNRMSMTRRGMPMNYMASSVLPMQLLAGLMSRGGGGNAFGSE